MKVSGRGARRRLVLEPQEVALLSSLLAEMTALFGVDDPTDEVQRRLFPAAYPDDGAAQEDYRSITESSLRDDRLARIRSCVDDLARGREIELARDETGTRWIQVLNDMRLALGTRIGVTEDEPDIDPTDPDAQPWIVYYWLTAVQDSVVTALMR